MPSPDASADTIPVVMGGKNDLDFKPADSTIIGKGARSIVVVYPSVYVDMYQKYPQMRKFFPKPQLFEAMEVILRHVVLNNEFYRCRKSQ
ncbi:hypothetical protein HY637_00155 [Candidatus Woesearchaeota archaeon]|nr:hypothetical protein [Candidatus Woesearchaeota archaeon]